MDKRDWWVPFKKIGSYSLGVHIKDIANFSAAHIVSENQDIDSELDTKVFESVNGECSIHTYGGYINVVTRWDYFYVLDRNVIGLEIQNLTNDLNSRFGMFEIEESEDRVYIDNELTLVFFEIKSLGIDFTTNVDHFVYEISASNYNTP